MSHTQHACARGASIHAAAVKGAAAVHRFVLRGQEKGGDAVPDNTRGGTRGEGKVRSSRQGVSATLDTAPCLLCASRVLPHVS